MHACINVNNGFELNFFLGIDIIYMYVKCENLEVAETVLDQNFVRMWFLIKLPHFQPMASMDRQLSQPTNFFYSHEKGNKK